MQAPSDPRARTQAPHRRRTGRPPKRADAVPTRQRLLTAAIAEFVERGFSQASVTDIAERAGISGPAVYKHFDGKADLLIQAARHSLDSTLRGPPVEEPPKEWDPVRTARRWLADDFAPTRRLLLELHLAAGRDGDLAALLTEWHLERTRSWPADRDDPVDRIKAFYLLLLGLAQVDVLDSLPTDADLVQDHVERMVTALFTDPTSTNATTGPTSTNATTGPTSTGPTSTNTTTGPTSTDPTSTDTTGGPTRTGPIDRS